MDFLYAGATHAKIELEWPREDSAVSAKGKGTGVVRGAGYDAMKGSGMNFVFFKYA